MNKWLIIGFILSVVIMGCQNKASNKKDLKLVEETPLEGKIKNSDIIRNPVSANKPVDTVNVSKIVFEESQFNFGKVNEGEEVNHTFTFTNTGKLPLVINDARSTCGCTVPDWPKEPIAPGGKGKINVVFKTNGKVNQQQKPVTISANTFPQKTVLLLKGFVVPKEDFGKD